jgi:hypothetical protein
MMRQVRRLLLIPQSASFAWEGSAFSLLLAKLDSGMLFSGIAAVVAGLLYSLKTTGILSILNKFSYNSLHYGTGGSL